MEPGPEGSDPLAFSAWVDTVGQAHYCKAFFEVYKNRSPGKSGVNDCPLTREPTRNGSWMGCIETQGSGRTLDDSCSLRKELDGFFCEDLRPFPSTSFHEALEIVHQVACGGKQSCVSGDSPHGVGVLVMDDSPQDSASICNILRRGYGSPHRQGAEAGFFHLERIEHQLFCQAVQGSATDLFQAEPEEDHPEI